MFTGEGLAHKALLSSTRKLSPLSLPQHNTYPACISCHSHCSPNHSYSQGAHVMFTKISLLYRCYTVLCSLAYIGCILRSQEDFLRMHSMYLFPRKILPVIFEMHLTLIPNDFTLLTIFLGAISLDLPGQAKKLIRALKSRSDFQDSWKLLTVWIGGNDLCAICKNDKHTVDKYVGGIRDALDMFHKEVSSLHN